ncbi:MAG: amylo-alpha-1,6-glucosidase [Endomicrobiales bacterium]
MKDIIQVRDKFYILASSSLVTEEVRVLKHDDTFALFDHHGDIRPLGFEDHGIYHQGTRFLSRFVVRLEDKSPLLLNSAVKEDNDFFLVHLTNPDFTLKGGGLARKGTLYVRRSLFLLNGSCHELLRIANFGLIPLEFTLSFQFDADYRDIFEVRGMKRAGRGEKLSPEFGEQVIALGYRGLDGVTRRTSLAFSHPPGRCEANAAFFPVKLAPQQELSHTLTVTCDLEEKRRVFVDYSSALDTLRERDRELKEDESVVVTSNDSFNTWLNRSHADLTMMLTRTEHGLYPYAGIPWYSTIFGRDGIITAFETLWINPGIARGVLSYLAARQAESIVPEQDAEPGKIVHEERKGEMAALREIPFGRYYGTVDATPLFVMLAGAYYERTDDRAFMERLWPHIERALAWIDTCGDRDQDGFVEYARSTERGLFNQGWKDSEDAVFHADGTLAPPAIALCEVQGYVYDAKIKACLVAGALGKKKTAVLLQRQAEALREKFLKTFWCDELGTYAIALDGEKKPCRVKSSNAGQCLFSGIASRAHATAVVRNLMSGGFFTGWGIRTVASTETRYNPMSYHNGSVWPHDNALIAYGMARYGFKDEALRVLTGLFDASGFTELRRLPELFCGFDRNQGEGPTLYPVACDPQAWASGSAFLLLQACLGLSIRAHENKIYFDNPRLPPFLRELHLKNLKVGSSVLEIALVLHENDVGVNIRQKEGDVEVVITK